MEKTESGATRHSRRTFLAVATLGVAAVVGVTSPMLGIFKRSKVKSSNGPQEFPGPDSIFHPASDPRLDPRRK